MSSPRSLVGSFVIMLFCVLLGIILNVTLAYGVDELLVRFGNVGCYDVSAVWDTSASLARIVNVFYLLMYVIPAFGIAFFILAAVRRQQYDKYSEYEQTGGGEF